MQRHVVIPVAAQAHQRLAHGTVFLHGTFIHLHYPVGHQRRHYLHHVGGVRHLVKFLDGGASLGFEESDDFRLPFGQLHRFLGVEVGVQAHVGFALHTQSGGECGLIHFAGSAEIIVGEPVPELDLREAHHLRRVEQTQYLLHLITGGRLGVHGHHHGGIELAAAEGHEHAVSRLQLPVQFGRNAVGESTLHGEGHQHVGVSLHRSECGCQRPKSQVTFTFHVDGRAL